MNFLRFLYKYYILFLLFTVSLTPSALGFQEVNTSGGQPVCIASYTYNGLASGAFNQLIIDSEYRAVIAGANAVHIFDGHTWNSFETPGAPVLSSTSTGILIGGKSFLAKLIPIGSGRYFYNTILNDSTLNFGQITHLGADSNGNTIFSTGKKLWLFNSQLVAIDSSEQAIKIFNTGHTSIIHSVERGLFEIQNHKIVQVEQGSTFANIAISNIVPLGNDLVVITSNNQWIQVGNGGTTPLTIPNLNEPFVNAWSYGANLIISTPTKLAIINHNREVVGTIKSSNKLPINSIKQVASKKGALLYAITNESLLHMLFPQNMLVYSFEDGIKGDINDLYFDGTRLMVATSTGIFAATYSQKHKFFNRFEPLHGSNISIKYITSTSSGLLALGASGIYPINATMQRIEKPLYTTKSNGVAIVNNTPLVTVFINQQNVTIVKEVNGKLKVEPYNTPSNSTIVSWTQLNSFVIIETQQGDRYRLTTSSNRDFAANWERLSAQELAPEQLVNIRQFGQKSFIYSNKSWYTYSNNSHFTRILNESTQYATQPIGVTSTNSLIVSNQDTTLGGIQSIHLMDKQKIIAVVPNGYRVTKAQLLPDSTVVIVTDKGLISVPPSFMKTQFAPPSIFINKIYKLKDGEEAQVIVGKTINNKIVESAIPVEQKHAVVFVVGSSGITSFNNIAYSAKLEGYSNNWSNWSTNNHFKYANLSAGEYTFRVKALDVLGGKSVELTEVVTIPPTIYQNSYVQIAFFILLVLAALTTIAWRKYRHAKEKHKLESIISLRTEELVREKEKTDNLLTRVLPKETATELKETGKVNTQRFKTVTVLFSDIQGFTRITDETNPEELIDQLDKFFLNFDAVVDKYKIEKIKTIGDAYMCAGGIPKKNRTNPVEVVLAAIEMMHFMRRLKEKSTNKSNIWDLRIGIDTGPVIAGVVGRNKLTYDIWGSTVNTASRMESSGEPGKINISENTYMFVKDYFICTYRGKMPVKNKGDIQMYFIEGILPSLSHNLEGVIPNHDFLVQLQLLRLGDLEEFVLEKLDKGLPKNLHYHNLKHTIDVYTQVELIGRSESLTNEELLIIRTAALFHDAGHLIDYDTHEEMSAKLAKEILPEYLYSYAQIDAICEIIMATKLPPRPKNLLEKIICDADLDYLGRSDFIPVSNNLYKELHEHGRLGTLQDWNELQIKFIEQHQYFTQTAQQLRNVNKNTQLSNIKAWMEKNK
ncbi:MAG: HD domain-containing protein [Bacteroidales bacterium]|nr:HD domain-containing protein [Bacteroidales bacterium]MBN2748531.1 HD domain-containing protein [Bacteroidales bacterium]